MVAEQSTRPGALEKHRQNRYHPSMGNSQQQQSQQQPLSLGMFAPVYWPVWLVVIVMWCIARLPMAWIFALGRGIGWLAFHLARSRRHITQVNIRHCFPDLDDDAQQQLVRSNFAHTGVGTVETALAWLNPQRDLSKHYRVEGLQHLQQAQAQGRGVVLVGAHYTTIDVTGQFLAQLGFVDVMYRRNKNPVWEWLQTRGRRHYFDGVVERSDMRQIIRSLQAGRAMWYAADQDYGPKHSVFAPFFGIPTATITVTSRLAQRNESPVLMLHQIRDMQQRTWTLRFSPVLENFAQEDAQIGATRLNALLEESLREVPDQYLWMHRRFKTRPPGQDSFYRKG